MPAIKDELTAKIGAFACLLPQAESGRSRHDSVWANCT